MPSNVWSNLWGYIWPAHSPETRHRVLISFACLIASKLILVAMPILYKQVVDRLESSGNGVPSMVLVPLSIIIGYGGLRILSQLFAELRDAVFVKVAQNAIRAAALKTFEHLHALSLRFHLERQTGGISRAIQRGATAMDNICALLVFSLVPTVIEILLVCGILWWMYDWRFSVLTVTVLTVYFVYTVRVTEWRVRYRQLATEKDEEANSKAIDSLLNYETVKYFNNEGVEARRYAGALEAYAKAETKSQIWLSVLNVGQGAIIAIGVTAIMIMSADGVVRGTMTLGDFVLTNTYLLQLYLTLDSLGWVYRTFKDAMVDMRAMFTLGEQIPEVRDQPSAPPISVPRGEVRFENVEFAYDPRRPILRNVSFAVPAGEKIAIVGISGSGKSTIARLLFRFYDVNAGRITIDGVDIRDVAQSSLRAAIGMVPQDTVLFNDTIAYNIAYGKPDASRAEIENAARMAQLDKFIAQLPDGYETVVGERGLKLSGGEKQRVAIARTLLKNPPIVVFDEATSALDSKTEKEIQKHLQELAAGHTAIVIAHRLSTVVDAHQIIVLDQGRIAESGSHAELLALGGIYANLWAKQSKAMADAA